ncbi:ABC transporter permease [Lachnobacterium bovis]|uniref:ABC transporter permease n=1 Tax=Lachnobacterium bovis TaxID=140626 RepID=UPI0004821868|nr:FtsX-like permease family protein [Lachnobacterium bovis]
MKWLKIYREYNLKQLKNSFLIHVCIMISILLAVATAISIPKVTNSITTSYENKATKINGGDITIQTSGDNQKLHDFLNSHNNEITHYTIGKAQNGSIKSSKNKTQSFYTDIITVSNNKNENVLHQNGNKLKVNEVIVSSYLASKLNLSKGDTIKLLDKEKKVVQIEKLPYGSSSQGKQLGYIKANIELTNPYAYIFYIDLKQPKKTDKFLSTLKKSLRKELSNDTTYSTTKDVIKENNNKQETSLVIVSLANTTCFIFTLFTTLSCAYMSLAKRKKDYAIMQLYGVKKSSIKNAFFFEMLFLIIIACVLGGIFSAPLENMLLAINGLGQTKTSSIFSMITVVGIAFFAFIYAVYIRILTVSIDKTNPYNVIKDIPNKKAVPFIRYTFFTLITLFAYSIYVGTASVFVSSIILIIALLIFFITCFILIKLICNLKFINKTTLYTLKKVSKRATTYSLVILSFVFMNIFLMLGYNLPKELSKSFNLTLKNDLPFNYMAMVKNTDTTEQNSLEKQIKKYSKIYIKNGLRCTAKNGKVNSDITAGFVEKDDYYYKYKIKKGKNITSISSNEIIISDEFAKNNKIKLNDEVTINTFSQTQYKLKVSGIYVCQKINPNLILFNGSFNSFKVKFNLEKNLNDNSSSQDSTTDYYQYLINKKSIASIKSSENTLFIGVNNIVDAMLGVLDGYVKMLKILGLICIFVAIIFSINVFIIFTKSDEKEQIIIRAIGIKKDFLQKTSLIETIIEIFLSIIIANIIYCFINKMLSKMLFNASGIYNFMNTLEILILTTIIALITYVIKLHFINTRSNNFDRLREDA